MKIANIRLHAYHSFTIQLHDQPQDAVGGGVLGTHVDHHVLAVHPPRHWFRPLFRFHDLLTQMNEFFVIPVHRKGNPFAAQGCVFA